MIKTEHFTFTLPDGSTNAFTSYQAEDSERAVIMIFPAMGVKSSYYTELGKQLADQGYVAALCDLRGIGASSVRASRSENFGYREMLNWDYAAAYRRVQACYPDKPIFLLGHSLGGQLACLFASEHDPKPDGLILVASCSVYYKTYQGIGRWRTLLGTQFLGIVARILGYWPGKQLGFAGLEAKGMIRDWSRQARTGKYVIGKERISYEPKLKQTKLPVLSISFEADSLSPRIPAQHLYQKFHAHAPITHIHLMADDPRNESFNHFNWAKRPAQIVSMIHTWLDTPTNI